MSKLNYKNIFSKELKTAGSSGSADAAPRMTEKSGRSTLIQSLRGGFANEAIPCRLPRPIGLAMTGYKKGRLAMTGECGRSMVEMLGVLAVIGVLSVAGIAGYNNAMNKHRANELINEANKRATVVAMQFASGKETASTIEFSGHSTFSGGIFDDTLSLSSEAGQFKLTLNNLLPEVCQQMKNTIGDTSVVRQVDCSNENSGLGYIYFNKDLSKEAVHVCALNESLSECVCPEKRLREEGKCGSCFYEEYQDWEQPKLTSNNSYGILIASQSEAAHPAWHLFDKKYDSKWYSDVLRESNIATVVWHLPTKLKASYMQLRQADTNWRFPTSIIVYGSNDGSNWNEIGRQDDCTDASSAYQIRASFSCDSFVGYEWLKWYFYRDTIRDGIAVADIIITAESLVKVPYEPDPETMLCE